MKAVFITFIFGCLHLLAYCEQAPYQMHELLLRYNLVAHVKISAHAEDHFRVRVINVLHKRKSGIVNGDYLKINYDFNVVCPPSFPIRYAEEHREALIFLSYHLGSWHLTQGNIEFSDDGNYAVSFHEEGYRFKASLAEWKENLAHYDSHFSLNHKGQIGMKVQSSELDLKSYAALTQLQYSAYYRKGRNLLSNNKSLEPLEMMVHLEEEMEAEIIEDEIYFHAATSPFSDSVMMVIHEQLIDSTQKHHPDFLSKGISGRTYYSLVIEKDGTISKVEIIRSIAPEIDRLIQAFFVKNNQWSKAFNENGQPIRFKQTMVLALRLNDQ